jgi:hypothetical protein
VLACCRGARPEPLPPIRRTAVGARWERRRGGRLLW